MVITSVDVFMVNQSCIKKRCGAEQKKTQKMRTTEFNLLDSFHGSFVPSEIEFSSPLMCPRKYRQ